MSHPVTEPTRQVLAGLALAAAILAGSRARAAEDVVVDAAAAFELLDAAPRDGVLTGPERAAVPEYDGDGDGRVTREEFARNYVEKKPAATWERHEFAREGFSCEMPLPPQPLALGKGGARFQVVADVPDPRVVLLARSRDVPARYAGKPALFFDSVAEQLERTGARIVERRAANLDLHAGSLIEVEWRDGRVEIVRSVMRGLSVYELDAIIAPGVGQPGRALAGRFLSSLQLVR